ncbi:MAG: type II toxin-antitoxin system RelE/ParE family toxin [Pseudomonadota bacterium]
MLAIDDGIGALLANPYIGHPWTRDGAYRQHYIPFGKRAYVLRYRLHEDALILVRLWHSREARD